MSDEALLAKWRSQEGKYATTPFLVSGPLVEALERGLPWAATELAELADLVPECLSPTGLLPTLSKLSDCPADYRKAIPWLRENAARLTWDAAAKRWVLPKP